MFYKFCFPSPGNVILLRLWQILLLVEGWAVWLGSYLCGDMYLGFIRGKNFHHNLHPNYQVHIFILRKAASITLMYIRNDLLIIWNTEKLICKNVVLDKTFIMSESWNVVVIVCIECTNYLCTFYIIIALLVG